MEGAGGLVEDDGNEEEEEEEEGGGNVNEDENEDENGGIAKIVSSVVDSARTDRGGEELMLGTCGEEEDKKERGKEFKADGNNA